MRGLERVQGTEGQVLGKGVEGTAGHVHHGGILQALFQGALKPLGKASVSEKKSGRETLKKREGGEQERRSQRTNLKDWLCLIC